MHVHAQHPIVLRHCIKYLMKAIVLVVFPYRTYAAQAYASSLTGTQYMETHLFRLPGVGMSKLGLKLALPRGSLLVLLYSTPASLST